MGRESEEASSRILCHSSTVFFLFLSLIHFVVDAAAAAAVVAVVVVVVIELIDVSGMFHDCLRPSISSDLQRRLLRILQLVRVGAGFLEDPSLPSTVLSGRLLSMPRDLRVPGLNLTLRRSSAILGDPG